jgi:4-carboxymuconolactone decarboxylase
MLEGLEYLKRIRPNGSRPGRRRETRSSNGRRILQRIYGGQTDKLLENIRQIHPEARFMILNDVYGRVFARSGLTLRERDLINVTVLALQRLDRQLYSHLRGSIRTGLHVDAIEDALLMIQRKSGRSMRTPRSLLRVVVSQRKK